MSGKFSRFGGIISDNLIIYLDSTKKDSYQDEEYTWYDLSGNNNNVKLHNKPLYTKDSINFTSENSQYLDTQYDVNNKSFTIDLIISPTKIDGCQIYVGKYNGGNSIYWWIGLATTFKFSMNNVIVDSYITPEENKTYYITCIKNYKEISIYINSELKDKKDSSNFATHTSIHICKLGLMGENYANVNLKQFRYYNRALSPEEISRNFNAVKNKFKL